jgi:hypothetical protein
MMWERSLSLRDRRALAALEQALAKTLRKSRLGGIRMEMRVEKRAHKFSPWVKTVMTPSLLQLPLSGQELVALSGRPRYWVRTVGGSQWQPLKTLEPAVVVVEVMVTVPSGLIVVAMALRG